MVRNLGRIRIFIIKGNSSYSLEPGPLKLAIEFYRVARMIVFRNEKFRIKIRCLKRAFRTQFPYKAGRAAPQLT